MKILESIKKPKGAMQEFVNEYKRNLELTKVDKPDNLETNKTDNNLETNKTDNNLETIIMENNLEINKDSITNEFEELDNSMENINIKIDNKVNRFDIKQK